MRNVRLVLTLASALTFTVPSNQPLAAAEPSGDELAGALSGAKVTLEQGLAAAAKLGQPISGKFEIEKGKLQLSVYTAKGGGFSEVIVDHVTGKVLKSEKITEGDDYKDATAQAGALRSSKTSLQGAVSNAVKANAGFRAVSVEPKGKDGKATAEIVLLRGNEKKVVAEPLQ